MSSSALRLFPHEPPRSRLAQLGLGVGGIASLLVAGCAQMPTGPSVAVMPAANKPFEVFMQDDQLCRGWAGHSVGLAGHDPAAEQFVASTLTGAAIGAVAGAVVGGHGNAGAGAAIGTVFGASAGTNQSAGTAWNAQRRYDIAYQQCMYSKGNLVPNYGYGTYHYPAPAPAPGALPPPPPPQR